MSDFEEFNPELEKALRDVTPVSASVKDAHISAALREIAATPRFGSGRLRILGGVAAALVLVVGAVAFVNHDASDSPLMARSETPLPAKTGAKCADEFSGLWAEVGDSTEITHDGQAFAVMFRDDNIDVYQATPPCSIVGTIGYRDALVARDNETSASIDSSVCSYTTEPVARFTDAARRDSYNLVLVHTDNGLSLHFEDRCTSPIATLALP